MATELVVESVCGRRAIALAPGLTHLKYWSDRLCKSMRRITECVDNSEGTSQTRPEGTDSRAHSSPSRAARLTMGCM